MFVVPNETPGMDIRPIRSLTGGVYHYEVFLDEVRVPAELRLGPEGEGFQALLNGLDSDRFWGRFYKAPALERVLRRLVDHANTTGATAMTPLAVLVRPVYSVGRGKMPSLLASRSHNATTVAPVSTRKSRRRPSTAPSISK